MIFFFSHCAEIFQNFLIIQISNSHFDHFSNQYFVLHFSNKLETLTERRPPWPRQIITLILPTVKMLSLGCEKLPTPLKKSSGSLPAPQSGCATTITVFFCSFTHLTIPRSPPKFNQFFLVLLRTRP